VCGLWVDSASNVNEYHEYFLGSKDGWCVGPSSCLEIWGLNRLKLSGPEQA